MTHQLRAWLEGRPAALRTLPFLTFLGLTFCQELPGEWTRYWIYAGKTVFGAWAVWIIRPLIEELGFRLNWRSVAVGVAMFGIWVGLEGLYPVLQEGGEPWNPFELQGGGTFWPWAFVGVRVAGSTLIVPVVEEVFYRSFLYRWIAAPDFLTTPLKGLRIKPFIVCAIVFGLGHREWAPGVLCAMAYQYLTARSGRLDEAVAAHAVTNLSLGIWVALQGDWRFWT